MGGRNEVGKTEYPAVTPEKTGNYDAALKSILLRLYERKTFQAFLANIRLL